MTPKEAVSEVQRIERELAQAYVGRTATIVSNYNGQDYGSSRPSKRGKTVEICRVHIDASGVYFFVRGERLSLREEELRFNNGEARGCDCGTPTTVHDFACPMRGSET